jgi:uncharacterized membrane protein YdjX (TVP38/TMEM64 family)
LFSSLRYRKLLVGLGLLALGGLTVAMFREQLTLEHLIDHERQLRQTLDERPFLGMLVGFLAFSAISFIPGLTGKALVVGWLFGLVVGLVIVNVGLTLVAVAEFWLARYFLRDAVQSRFGFYLHRMNESLEVEGAFYVFAMRMMHFPYTMSNYALGATSVRTWSFWWATQLGLLPGNLIFVFVGSQFPSLRQLAEEGPSTLVTMEITAALIVLGIVPLALRRMVVRWHGRYLQQLTEQKVAADEPAESSEPREA